MTTAVLSASSMDAAVALWQETGLTRPWNDPRADFLRALAGPSSCVLGLGARDDVLIGTVMVGHDGHRGWVYYLAVKPDQQHRGLGRELMHAAESWLRDQGVPKLNLMVRTTNESVIAFYRRLGYEESPVVVLARLLSEQ